MPAEQTDEPGLPTWIQGFLIAGLCVGRRLPSAKITAAQPQSGEEGSEFKNWDCEGDDSAVSGVATDLPSKIVEMPQYLSRISDVLLSLSLIALQEEWLMENLLTVASETHHAKNNHHRRYEVGIGRDLQMVPA